MIERRQLTLDHGELVDRSIELLRDFCSGSDVYGAFSGGKDSCVIKHLSSLAGINVQWVYNVTTIDPPELVRFIKRHPDVKFIKPKVRFFRLVEKKGYPTRARRWCCSELKESFSVPATGILITGVRATESPRRAKQWRVVNIQKTKHYRIINPILYWADSDVWNYIYDYNIPYCSLYDDGFKRLGCIGCPMSHRRASEIERWPAFKTQWRNALLTWWNRPEQLVTRATRTFDSFDRFWAWYWSNESMPPDPDAENLAPCQLMFSE